MPSVSRLLQNSSAAICHNGPAGPTISARARTLWCCIKLTSCLSHLPLDAIVSLPLFAFFLWGLCRAFRGALRFVLRRCLAGIGERERLVPFVGLAPI